jgi:hypothetical protein
MKVFSVVASFVRTIECRGGVLSFEAVEVGTREALLKKIQNARANLGRKDTVREDLADLEAWRREGAQVMQDNVSALKQIYKCMDAYIEGYPLIKYQEVIRSASKLKVAANKDSLKHFGDSEQSVMRCLDIFFADETLATSAHTEFMLHIHTRLDMCRYCLECMHEKARSTSYWRKYLGQRPLKVFVSSRQDYREGMGELKCHGMRFIGLDDRSHGQFDNDLDSDLVGRGIIFQMAIPHSVQARFFLESLAAQGGGAAEGGGVGT